MSSKTELSQQRRQPITAKNYGPDPVDVHVGKRLKIRRTLLGISQEQLSNAVGVTFQQIQKYERGSNRVSASRLYDIARVLGVGIPFFFEDIDDDATANRPTQNLPRPTGMAESEPNPLCGDDDDAPPFHDDPLSRTETLELVRHYWRLPQDDMRRHFLELLRSLSRRE